MNRNQRKARHKRRRHAAQCKRRTTRCVFCDAPGTFWRGDLGIFMPLCRHHCENPPASALIDPKESTRW